MNINVKRRDKENEIERDKEKKKEESPGMVEVVGTVGVEVAALVIHLADDASKVKGDPGQEVDLHHDLSLKSHLDMLKVVAEAVEEETHHSGLTRRLEMMKYHRSSLMLPN